MRSWAGYGKNDPHILAAIASGDLTVDAETGHVTYRGKPVGTFTADGFVVLSIRRFGGHGWVSVCAHRVAYLYFHGGVPVGMIVRHGNGHRWDNRPNNLELANNPRALAMV